MTCEKCNHELRIGDFPFCPHESGAQAIVSDEWVGGRVFENGFDKPTRFFSPSEHRAALAARGLEVQAKWSGPNDKHLSRMDIPCAATLESAKVLLSRKKSTPFAPDDAYERIPITVTPITFAKER